MSDFITIELPPEPSAVILARQFVAEHAGDLPEDRKFDAELLVSELVANAVQHGQPDIRLSVSPDPPGIWVQVSDEGDYLPQLPDRAPDSRQPNGRGLRLVDAIADSWGVKPADSPPGKTVWFEIRISS
ncbi:MAG TPA: ATP-binding protein [Jatrophihabitans sp.]|nr:ATP-binding protein [Jatrophihabitans sp.]